MTTVLERVAAPSENGGLFPEFREAYSAALLQEPDPTQQIIYLQRNHYRYAYAAEAEQLPVAHELADLAAGTHTELSAIVRIEALERALSLGYGADTLDRGSEDMRALKTMTQDPTQQGHFPRMQDAAQGYRYVCRVLLDHAQVSQNILFPPQTDLVLEETGGDYRPDYNAAFAYSYLDALREELGGPQPSAEALRFKPLIDELQNILARHHGLPKAVDISFHDWGAVAACSKLFRHGDHYSAEFAELMNSDSPDKMAYIRRIAEVSREPQSAANAFPARYQKGVEQGMENLLVDAAYAVNYHLQHANRTDIVMPLKNGRSEIPLQLNGDEPLELLRVLDVALSRLSNIASYSGDYIYTADKTLKATKADGFSVYRLIDRGTPYRDSRLHPDSLYIRPYGDVRFDREFEFGRNGEGVEASINYVVDTSGVMDRLPAIGKHRAPGDDDRISIRLDREGLKRADRKVHVTKDPTQQAGALSLDIGSVLGKDTWASTRLGRFLAWGNFLRTRAQGELADLNHMTDHFTEEDGDADVFALQAARMIEALDRRSISASELKKLFAGRAALDGASK